MFLYMLEFSRALSGRPSLSMSAKTCIPVYVLYLPPVSGAGQEGNKLAHVKSRLFYVSGDD